MSENKKDIEQDEIYDGLKGFFPEEYDLTPDELLSDMEEADSAVADTSPEAEHETETSASDDDDMFLADAEGFCEDVNIPFDTEESTSDANAEPSAAKSEAATADVVAPAKKKKKSEPIADLYDIIEMFAICTAVIIVFFSFFARLTVVDGDSMNNTLTNGETLLITDFLYEPDRGDIVVVQDNSLQNEALKKPLIKRIIATGGETVDVSAAGVVTVTSADDNSFVLDEEYAFFEGGYSDVPEGHYEVPEGCIFVMGDNRNGSTDSRFSSVGAIDERCIVGKAFLRLTPLDKLGALTNPFNK